MRQSILSLFFLIVVTSFSCTVTKPPVNDDGHIFMWDKNVAITWNDFIGPVDKETKWSAVTTSFLAYQIINKNKLRITACFNRDQSWHVTERDRPDLLKHEQYHFNITEVCAREMRKLVMQKRVDPAKEEFNNIYSIQTKLCNAMQQEYDEITSHGQNKEQQVLQEKSIDDKLKALEEFSNPIITY